MKIHNWWTKNAFCRRNSLSVLEYLLGSDITIYTDDMNNMNSLIKYVSKDIQHLWWLIEEFSLKFIYLKDSVNSLADALSQLDIDKDVT